MMSTGLQYCRHARLLSLVVFSFVIPASSQTIIYVDADAVGSNDGLSWEDAFVYLQDALAIAEAGDEIWVAEGVHRPDQGAGMTAGDREARFVLPAGIALYGGFAGTENSFGLRDIEAHPTVLSGDLLGDDTGTPTDTNTTRTDNAHQVVSALALGESAATIVDGLEVRSAHSGANAVYRSGIDAIGNVKLANLIVADNYSGQGAGIDADDSESGCPEVRNVVFSQNVAAFDGGGLRVDCASGALVRDVSFFANEAANGAALYNLAVADVVNATIVNNSAIRGAIYSAEYTKLSLYNTVILGNAGEFGGGLHAEGTRRLSMVNSLVAGNSGLYGAGLFSSGEVEVINSTIAFNQASEFGGAIAHVGVSPQSVRITNSIIWGNSGLNGGQTDNQIWADTASNAGPVAAGSSLIQPPFPVFLHDDGATIEVDPAFVDPDGVDGVLGTLDDDYTLLSTSPAIDAGRPDYLPEDRLDLDGDGDVTERLPVDARFHERFFDGGSGGPDVDLGPFEFGAPPVTVSTREPKRATVPSVLVVYPNPTAGGFFVETNASHSNGETTLEIYDITGQLQVQSGLSGAQRTQIDASGLRSGVYIAVLRTTSGQIIDKARLVVISR